MAAKGRLIAGFVLGAASVLAVELVTVVISAPPTAVVAGCALPATTAVGRPGSVISRVTAASTAAAARPVRVRAGSSPAAAQASR